MSETTLVDNEYITVQYLPDKKALYHVVHQPIGGQPLRNALMIGFNAIQEYGISKWLSDDRKNGPMSEEDRRWGEVNLNQRAMKAGWKYWALVVPEEVIAAGSMIPTMEALYDYGLRMMVFSNVEEGFKWLDGFED